MSPKLMSSTLRFRPAGPGDLPGLLAIEQQCFSGDRISPRQMRYMLSHAKAVCWVAEDQNTSGPPELIGYGLCLHPALPRPARLYSLAVLPKWSGQGIANRLCELLIKALVELGYQRLRLEVADTNTAAKGLYQRLGFHSIAKLPGYYDNGDNGVRMERQLAEPV